MCAGKGPPSTREVAAARLKSSRSGHVRLRKLLAEGCIEVGDGEGLKRRPVRLTPSGWEAVGEMPMLGRMAAGPGIDAVAVEKVSSGLVCGVRSSPERAFFSRSKEILWSGPAYRTATPS